MRRGMVASWLMILGFVNHGVAKLLIYVIKSHLARVVCSELRSSGCYRVKPDVNDVQQSTM